ncbi:MAG TPA: polyphosphate kinase 1 [Anaerolineae bacterium]|nr:polyphosphate kinase 1 [Anaerolineae bacterium]HQH39430.1 polyphosphate kinase 1 [Anaerolineae bacterium]
MPKKKPDAAVDERKTIDWNDPSLYFNRELSFLQLNLRVLEEALDERHPLLERVKFLSIYSSNLDEFFMIRVSGLYKQLVAGVVETPPDGMTPAEQLAAIRREILPPLTTQMNCWLNDLLPKLAAEGIHILKYEDLKGKQRKLLRRYFEQEIFPVLTPLAFDPGHPFPHISNLSINLAVVVRDPLHGELFARLKIPGVFPRLLRIPEEARADDYDPLGLKTVVDNNFVWIEEVVAANLGMLFPGVEVVAAYPFRVTRDADLEIEEDEAADLLETIEESVERRQFGSAVRLEVDKHMPKNIRDILSNNLEIPPYLVYTADGPIGLADVIKLMSVDRPDLKDTPFVPFTPRALAGEENIFAVISRKKNILLYHPYDSFTPVVDFLEEAARDPQVLAIKQTLYRVGTNAPVVDALLKAREHGKQVAVLVELKARFDEENNITWARALERAGVHVTYGLVGLKTHAKVCMVVRREPDGMKRYVHLATGNYNAVTARIYTDMGYFTVDPDIGADVADLFNTLTGYSRLNHYRKLLVAPHGIRTGIIARIEREIEAHQKTGDGSLAFKMNQLVDKECIIALYRASQAGVKVDLQVRGICCLRPGVPGVSENIRVTSIVGRFLEHPRIFYFHNGGDEEILLGSADLMPRNLDRRVETLFPVEDPDLRVAIRDNILRVHLRDNVQARVLMPEGAYKRVRPRPGEEEINSQLWMIGHRGIWHIGE